MRNLLEEEAAIRQYPDEVIESELMKSPENSAITQFLGAIELTKRAKQRRAAQRAIAARRASGSTVVEDILNGVGQQGLAQLAPVRSGYSHGGIVVSGTAHRPKTPEEELAMYRAAGIEPPQELVDRLVPKNVPMVDAIRRLSGYRTDSSKFSSDSSQYLLGGYMPDGSVRTMSGEIIENPNVGIKRVSPVEKVLGKSGASAIDLASKSANMLFNPRENKLGGFIDRLKDAEKDNGTGEDITVEDVGADSVDTSSYDQGDSSGENESGTRNNSRRLAEALALAQMANSFATNPSFVAGFTGGAVDAAATLAGEEAARETRADKMNELEVKSRLKMLEMNQEAVKIANDFKRTRGNLIESILESMSKETGPFMTSSAVTDAIQNGDQEEVNRLANEYIKTQYKMVADILNNGAYGSPAGAESTGGEPGRPTIEDLRAMVRVDRGVNRQ